MKELNRATRNLPDRVKWHAIKTPPVLDVAGEHWMRNLMLQYDVLHEHFRPQACMIWDDDFLYTPEGLKELRGVLVDMQGDHYQALSVFLWDAPDRYNPNMLGHWSPVLWRCVPGDQFALHYVVAAPEKVAKSRYYVKLGWPVLNYGYMDEADRREAWGRSKEAGRVDAHSLQFVEEVETKKWANQPVRNLLGQPGSSTENQFLASTSGKRQANTDS